MDERDGLSERERTLLPLFVQGLTDREIAARLLVSVLTVKAHRARILRKLGAGPPDRNGG